MPFPSENRREAFSMFPKRKKFQWFRILGMFSVLWHAQHTRVHRNSQKNESIHCNYICKKNFARGWLLRDFTLERVKDWWCVKDRSLTVLFGCHTIRPYILDRQYRHLPIMSFLSHSGFSLEIQRCMWRWLQWQCVYYCNRDPVKSIYHRMKKAQLSHISMIGMVVILTCYSCRVLNGCYWAHLTVNRLLK